MNAPVHPPRKRRRHPLALLIVWLGMALATALLALAWAIGAAPADEQLDSAYNAGMGQGYLLCREAQEVTQ